MNRNKICFIIISIVTFISSYFLGIIAGLAISFVYYMIQETIIEYTTNEGFQDVPGYLFGSFIGVLLNA